MAIPKPRERREARQKNQRREPTARPVDAVERVLSQMDPRGLTPSGIRRLFERLNRPRSEPSMLAPSPSAITLQALEVIRPHALYLSLAIDAFGTADARAEADREALATHERENKRWRDVAKHLNAAWYAARDAERGLSPASSFDAAKLSAIDVLAGYALEAHQRAGEEEMRVATLRIHRTPKATIATSRERVAILERELGWTRGKIADLIIASQGDWNPPPIQLQPALANYKTLKWRIENLLRPRPNRRRSL